MRHQSTQFDADLDSITSKVLQMGGMVESQLSKATQSLTTFNGPLADHVMQEETQIDQLEMQIDAECISTIARWQPIAVDLRYIMAISKIITNLERAGDEAERIAKRTKHIMEDPSAHIINFSEIKVASELAAQLLKGCLDAFARADAVAAARVIEGDRALDDEFRAFVRKLHSYMTEDPRTIKVALDFLFIAKAIERIGDHATNVAELVIFQVIGKDVRHSNRDEVAKQISMTQG